MNFNKLYKLILNISFILAFSILMPFISMANESNINLTYDPLTDTYKGKIIIINNELSKNIPLSIDANSGNAEFFRGSRPKKWIFEELGTEEYTDRKSPISVVKSINGSSISLSATRKRGLRVTGGIGVQVKTIAANLGIDYEKSYEISGSATAEIPEGYKLAYARGYILYEKTHFKAKLVHVLNEAMVYKRKTGTISKPVGIEIEFEFKEK